ncbi:MAG: hypothetical protein ACREP7_23015 [Lysobacter sp.]
MNLAAAIKVLLFGLAGVLALALVFALWLCPVAWVLRRSAERTLRAPVRYATAMIAVQLALMSSLLGIWLCWPLLSRVPEWVGVATGSALPWLAMTVAVRLTIRDGERRPPSWPRASGWALAATLTWWLATALLLSLPLLLGWLSPPMMLAG